tara:strand:- start:660 stop:1424 length:765 start_codon:yes stop_codon:yes gene_type:complete
MIDVIYIPTLGRTNNQITFDNLPQNVQDITWLVVQPKEHNSFGDYPRIVLPDDNIGITATRKYIYEWRGTNTKYGVFDDDLKFIERTPNGPKTKRPMDKGSWEELLGRTSEWLDEIPFSGMKQGDLPPSGREYKDTTGVNCAFFFNDNLLPSSDTLDWSLPVCEDIHLVLQLLKMGYNNRIWEKFGYISKILAPGGCNIWRTLDLINETHEKLIKLHPAHVSWNGIRPDVLGGDFKKIKIKWKQAYREPGITLF